MVIISLGVVGALVLVALLLYDMDRKRQRMMGILERVVPLVPKKQKNLRVQNMRRLSMSIFMNQQLMPALEKELLLLERDHDVAPPDVEKGGFSLSTSKTLQMMEDRVSTIEVIAEAKEKEEAAAKAAEEARWAPTSAGDEAEVQPADETEDANSP